VEVSASLHIRLYLLFSSPPKISIGRKKDQSVAGQGSPEDIHTQDEVTDANNVSIWAMAVSFSD
jgi:hypothetical protein